jgi:ABC-2 type transport system permease protein
MTFSPALAGLRAVAGKHLRIFLRSPMEVTLTLFSPVLWLALFGVALSHAVGDAFPGTGGSYLAFLAPGLVALTALTASLFAGATFFLEVERGEAKQYLVAPMARSEYYLGLASAAAVKTVAQSAVILLLAIPLGMRLGAPLAALAALVAVTLFAIGAFGFSAWLASRSPSFEAFHGMLILLNLPLLFVSDALYPLDGLPAGLRWAASANPLTHLIELLRELLAGQASPLGLGVNVAVLAGFVVVGFVLGGRAVQRLAR